MVYATESKVTSLNLWQKSGLLTAGTAVLVNGILRSLSHVWWYQETKWFRALAVLNAPAWDLANFILNRIGVPALYDVPLPWREAVLIELTNIVLGVAWWFTLGAIASIVWRLAKNAIGTESHSKQVHTDPMAHTTGPALSMMTSISSVISSCRRLLRRRNNSADFRSSHCTAESICCTRIWFSTINEL